MEHQYKTRVILHPGNGLTQPFCYFVVQKVACTSVKTALAPLFGMDSSIVQEERREGEGPRFPIHLAFDKSESQIQLPRFTRRLKRGHFENHFRFAFVRNPFDRLLSCWSDKIANVEGKGLSWQDEEHGLVKGLSFPEFVRLVGKIPDEESNPHYRSQYVTLVSDGVPLPQFVGRFESLAEDFGIVSEKIGAPYLSLPHRLRSKAREGKHYRDFYDDDTRKIATERFATDLKRFGYSF